MLCWNLRLECYISSLQTVMWTLVTMTELGWRKSDDQTVTDHFTIVLTHLAQVWFVKMNHFNENRSYFYSYRKSFLFGPLKFNSPLIILFFFFSFKFQFSPVGEKGGEESHFFMRTYLSNSCVHFIVISERQTKRFLRHCSLRRSNLGYKWSKNVIFFLSEDLCETNALNHS